MKILSENKSQGIITVQPEHLEDLWCLHTLLDQNDKITGTAFRKITLGDKSSENTKTIKKPIRVQIALEKAVFSENLLKVQGVIQEGPEDIPKGSHQSINIEPNDVISIQKKWMKYQRTKLDDAIHNPKTEIVACIFDREQAIFARLINNSFSSFLTLNGEVERKGEIQSKQEDFFETISKNIKEINTRFAPSIILCGSSHFWKQNLLSKLDSEITKKTVFASIGDVNPSAFNELLGQTEVQHALKTVRAAQDAQIVEELFAAISKSKNIAYGLKDTQTAAKAGAIDKLLCSEKLIKKKREDNTFNTLENLFELVENAKGSIVLLSGNSDASRKLDGLGGLAAFLRFPLE